jgi:hypothetical protein
LRSQHDSFIAGVRYDCVVERKAAITTRAQALPVLPLCYSWFLKCCMTLACMACCLQTMSRGLVRHYIPFNNFIEAEMEGHNL